MKHVFILNPAAGKNDAAESMRGQIAAAAEACGAEPLLEVTRHPGHAAELAELYAASGEHVRLYAVGGDGTLNDVMRGAYLHKNAEVACVPVGSGNDFIRSFGAAADFLDLTDLMRGEARHMDLMKTDTGICLSITSAGMDAEVAYRIPAYRRIPLLGGSMAYNISVVRRLMRPLGMDVDVIVDGETYSGNYVISAVCNGTYYGGGFAAAPVADLQDGLLDVVMVKKISLTRVAAVIGPYKNGRHFGEDGKIIEKFADAFLHLRAKDVTITPTAKPNFILNVDGECGPAKRLYARVLPLAGRFVLPQKLLAQQPLCK